MADIVEIIIKTVDETSGANGSIISSFTELKSKIDLAKETVKTIGEIYNSTVGETIKYADEVRQLSLLTGLSTENASRFLEVADKTNVSVGALEMGLKFMAKNGVEPTISGIAQLSDEYLKLAPGVERDNFLIKEFGRSGFEMAQLMSQGSDAINRMSESTSKNLILTQQQVDAAKRAEIAQKELGDAWKGNVVVLSNMFIPAITTLMNQFVDLNASIEQNGYWYTVFHQNSIKAATVARENSEATKADTETIIRARDAVNSHADALNNDSVAMSSFDIATKSATDDIEAMTKANNGQMSLVMKLQGVMTDYNKTLAETTKKYGENSKEVAALEAQHAQSMRSIAYDLYVAKLQADGFTDAEYRTALSAGVAMGVIDQATASMAADLDSAASSAAGMGSELSNVKSIADALSGKKVDITVTTTYVTIGTPTTEAPGMCFLAGTLITLANRDKRKIEDVKIGDLLTSYDVEKNCFVSSRVRSVMSRNAEGYLIINGIRVTSEHPFWCGGEWKKAGELRVGDVLFGENEKGVEIESIMRVSGPAVVYNIEVDSEVHNYFAEGILVHNKNVNRMLAEPAKGGSGALPGSAQGAAGVDAVSYNVLVQALTEAISRVAVR